VPKNTSEGLILVVDDDNYSRALHREILAKRYDVVTASSGKEALEMFDALQPDLILMDALMPDMDGYEASQEIRKRSGIPIVFVTGVTSIEEHLRAYDSGGTGLLTKPVNADLLTKKVDVALERYFMARRNEQEKQELQKMAMSFLSTAGKSGALLNFMRSAIAAPSYAHLAQGLLDASNTLNLNCVVRISHGTESTALAYHGAPTPLELSIMDHASEMGRIFQFRNRLVVNYERVTIVVSNTPDDPEEAGMVRDNVAILAETAQALAENIDIRRASAQQAEQMQLALSSAEHALTNLGDSQRSALADVQILLQELVDSVENSYSWLNTSHQQEAEISGQMQNYVSKILSRLANDSSFEQPLEQVIKALRAGYDRPDSIELF